MFQLSLNLLQLKIMYKMYGNWREWKCNWLPRRKVFWRGYQTIETVDLKKLNFPQGLLKSWGKLKEGLYSEKDFQLVRWSCRRQLELWQWWAWTMPWPDYLVLCIPLVFLKSYSHVRTQRWTWGWVSLYLFVSLRSVDTLNKSSSSAFD